MLGGLFLADCSRQSAAQRNADQGRELYGQGKYAEALPLLQKARDAGLAEGTLLYEIGYCREVVEGKPDARREIWREAEAALAKEVAAPEGATVERLYELTVIASDRGDFDAMTRLARQAVDRHEKGPDPNALAGEDWFRLGRLHDFLSEASEAEAAYRRGVSAFAKVPASNPSYHALALLKVAELDFGAGRYEAAAAGYDGCLKLLPGTRQVDPYRHAIALTSVGRFEEAIARFGEDRSEETATDAQYAADLARKAKEVAPLDDKDLDGAPLTSLTDDALLARIKDAAATLRAARTKYSMKAGDPLPPEVALRQKRFVSLLRQELERRKALQELCLREGIADLVRR